MMKTLMLFIGLLVSIPSFAQFGYDVSTDKENGMKVFKGDFTFGDLKNEKTFTWFTTGAASYKPDSAAMTTLKKHLNRFEIVVLMGTWCDDSHNLVPKLYKVMQQTGYPEDKCKIYGLDRAKEAKGMEHRIYQVTKVPTVIVFQDHIEIGRIVETVKKSIEEDLAKIIRKRIDEEEKENGN